MRAIERAWRGARNEWRMHVVSALSSSVAFLCLAFALLMVSNLTRLQERWQTAGQLSAYLDDSVSGAEVTEVVRALRGTRGVASARHVPAETARTEMLEASPTTLLEMLPSSSFPASIEVELEEATTADRAQVIVQQLKAIAGVESVETYGSWTVRVARFVRAANAVALFLTLIVSFAVVTVVGSTTKLMLERRRDEVEVLRTVGATRDYVRQPFLLEGAIQGGLGALVAVVLCALAFGFLQSRFDTELTLLLGIEPRFLPLALCVGLIGTGAVLGGLAASISLRRSFTS